MAVVIKYFGMPSCCVNCDICLPCALDEGLCYITQHTIGNIYAERPCDCPLVEIEECKTGLCWIERFDNEDKWLECPYCHKDSDNAYNYCPNCGAKMRGSENEGKNETSNN